MSTNRLSSLDIALCIYDNLENYRSGRIDVSQQLRRHTLDHATLQLIRGQFLNANARRLIAIIVSLTRSTDRNQTKHHCK